MDRVISKFNPENSSGMNIIYGFIFDGYSPIYIEIKNGFGKILDDPAPLKIDTIVRTTHTMWQKICMHEISAKDALSSNLIKCDGEEKNYTLLANLLDDEKANENILDSVNYPYSLSAPSEDKKEDEKEDLSYLIGDTKITGKSKKESKEKHKIIRQERAQNILKEKEKLKEMKKEARLVDKENRRKIRLEKLKAKEKKQITVPSTINIMVNGFDPNVAKDKDILYKFVFKNHKSVYIKVSKGTAKILTKSSEKPDTTIITDIESFYNIILGKTFHGNAFLNNTVKCEGDLKNYTLLFKIFKPNYSSSKRETVTSERFNLPLWMIISLIPWILYWGVGNVLNPIIISSSAIIYTTIISVFLKPKEKKALTKLESLTIFLFSLYGLLGTLKPDVFNDVMCSFLLNIVLIFMYFLSIKSSYPAVTEYSSICYNKTIFGTKLCRNLSKNLTIIWGIIFTIRFILQLVLESPVNNIGYIFIILGIVVSYIYPKYKLGR